MANPKISVLMSVFNGTEFLEMAIDSVLEQTFSDFEFIVVDDCSDDDTLKIIGSYKDSRIVLIHNSENLGLTKSLNIGLQKARGAYVARMDADDICLPHRFSTQFDYLEKNLEIAVCGSWIESIENAKIIKYPVSQDEVDFRLLYGPPVAHPAAMMRRSVFERYALRYDEDFFAAQDYDLWARVSDVGQITNIVEPLLKYRVHDSQISKLRGADQECSADIVRKRQLLKLGIDASLADVARHTQFFRGEFDGKTESFAWVEAWIQALIDANMSSRQLEPRCLENQLAAKLWFFCNAAAAAGAGLATWNLLRGSAVYGSVPATRLNKVNLFLKCFLKPSGY